MPYNRADLPIFQGKLAYLAGFTCILSDMGGIFMNFSYIGARFTFLCNILVLLGDSFVFLNISL